ncbi:HRDC-like protein [Amanita muscaria]
MPPLTGPSLGPDHILPHSKMPSPLADGQNSHLRTVIARPIGWDTLARKWNKSLLFANNNDGGGKVVRMYAWRDKVAREEDESVRYVLPNHHLLQIVEQPPNNLAALLNTFPSNPPPVIRKRARELLDVIREALKTTSQQDSTMNKLDITPEIPSET